MLSERNHDFKSNSLLDFYDDNMILTCGREGGGKGGLRRFKQGNIRTFKGEAWLPNAVKFLLLLARRR